MTNLYKNKHTENPQTVLPEQNQHRGPSKQKDINKPLLAMKEF